MFRSLPELRARLFPSSPPAEAARATRLLSPFSRIPLMKFAAIIDYGPDLSKIQEIRPTHRQYLGELLKNGKLAISGPFVDDSGALIVYEADSKEEAESMIAN